jgi:hypothetical protein
LRHDRRKLVVVSFREGGKDQRRNRPIEQFLCRNLPKSDYIILKGTISVSKSVETYSFAGQTWRVGFGVEQEHCRNYGQMLSKSCFFGDLILGTDIISFDLKIEILLGARL